MKSPPRIPVVFIRFFLLFILQHIVIFQFFCAAETILGKSGQLQIQILYDDDEDNDYYYYHYY